MNEREVPVSRLPGTWRAHPTDHPEVPSSEPVAELPAGESPPHGVYDVRENVRLAFGPPVAVYGVYDEIHVYPTRSLTAEDVLLHVYEKRGDRPIRFGNRTRRVHLHGNTVAEIRAGEVTNDATGVVIHRADGTHERVTGTT